MSVTDSPSHPGSPKGQLSKRTLMVRLCPQRLGAFGGCGCSESWVHQGLGFLLWEKRSKGGPRESSDPPPPHTATLPEESRDDTEDGPPTKGAGTSCPSYSSSSCSLSSRPPRPAHRGLPSQLAGKPGAEPSAVSSLRLATAMAAQGQARAAGEEPVKGSPYEWVLIGL